MCRHADTECRGVRLLNPGALMRRREMGFSTYMILTFDGTGGVNAEKRILKMQP